MSCVFGVRSRRKKGSAERKENRCVSVMHRSNRIHGVVTVTSRRLEFELNTKFFKEGLSWTFGDPHRAIALHITVTADGAKSGAGLSQLTAQQHEVHNFLNVCDCILMLRQSHGPTKDSSIGI